MPDLQQTGRTLGLCRSGRQGFSRLDRPSPTLDCAALRTWMTEAKITDGQIFRAINKAGRIARHGFSPKVIWGVVKQACKACDPGNVAPHDLRRTCARLCHERGGELEQIQFLLGHESVQDYRALFGMQTAFPRRRQRFHRDRARADPGMMPGRLVVLHPRPAPTELRSISAASRRPQG